jgi:hypothetical protein
MDNGDTHMLYEIDEDPNADISPFESGVTSPIQ